MPCPRQDGPQAPSSAPLTAQSSASTAFRVSWVQIPLFMASDQFNTDPNTLVLTTISVPSHLGESVPPRYPDNPSRLALAARAPTNRRLALPASSSIAGIFFIELLSTGIVADHGEHLNTKPDSSSM